MRDGVETWYGRDHGESTLLTAERILKDRWRLTIHTRRPGGSWDQTWIEMSPNAFRVFGVDIVVLSAKESI